LFTSYNLQKEVNPYYNKQNKPSSWGIDTYVKNNEKTIIAEYEYLIDTLYDVYIFTEDFSKNENGTSIGNFYIPDYVIITNEERYIEYEYKNLSKYQQNVVPFVAKTVKGVIFHELTHAYFNQITLILKQLEKPVVPEYGNLRIFPNPNTRLGAEFIEEGVCEYVVYHLKEASPIKNLKIPITKEELLDTENYVTVVYNYSVLFLQDFLDTHGIKEGIQILVTNPPPSYEEMLNPTLFFNRLKKF